ncbi:MAG: hypothetical protein KDA74_24270 [Planctomycetaceae bacterium]|nr:hypothetical protein [Planctomycetaceae bacterium]
MGSEDKVLVGDDTTRPELNTIDYYFLEKSSLTFTAAVYHDIPVIFVRILDTYARRYAGDLLPRMSQSTRRKRTSNHRLKELVRSTGKIDVASQRGLSRKKHSS